LREPELLALCRELAEELPPAKRGLDEVGELRVALKYARRRSRR